MSTTVTELSAISPSQLTLSAAIADGQAVPIPDSQSLESIHHEKLSTGKTAIIITSVTCVTAIGSLLNGAVTVGLPAIADDVGLQENLLLWPASVFALTCGCTLLVFGALADLFGARKLYLLGCFLQSIFTMSCGLSKSGTQLIAFRALAGISSSMCLPSAVSLITNSFPVGKRRNLAFATMGGGQPVGFSIGLGIGGVFVDTIGWQWAFYLAAILNTCVLAMAFATLPAIGKREPVTWHRVVTEIDWMGALLASCALAMISYVFAVITDDSQKIAHPINITLLCLSAAAVVLFILWVGRQERLGKPAIIPNSLWKNRIFTSVCLNVFLVWGAFNATETLASFFFQYVQKLSSMETSVRVLPAPIGGALASVFMALFVHKIRADTTSFVAVVIASVAPLLMAIANPQWTYWACVFPAMLTNAIGADTLYTISNLVVTSVFPSQTQGIAGGVYNTIAQIGRSFGITAAAAVASAITAKSRVADKKSPDALLEGYRAAFWYCFAANVFALLIIVWGLRKIGKVGLKQD